MLIEPHRIFIARPHVQRDIVTTLFPCESQHILIKCGSDMSASEFFIHTEVIDIQRSDIGQDVVSDMLLEDTERISRHRSILLRHEYRT